MLKKINHIFIGWGKRLGWLPTSEAEHKLAELRLKSCQQCPNTKESKLLKIVNGHGAYEKEIFCTLCKCPCSEKTIVVEEKCPIGKW